MIYKKAVIPTIMDMTTLANTYRDNNAFGSIERRISTYPSPIPEITNESPPCNNNNDDHVIPFDNEYIEPNS